MPDKSETFIETTFGEPWKQSCSFDNFSQYKRGGVPPKQQQPSSQSQIQVVLPFSTIPDKFSACQISDCELIQLSPSFRAVLSCSKHEMFTEGDAVPTPYMIALAPSLAATRSFASGPAPRALLLCPYRHTELHRHVRSVLPLPHRRDHHQPATSWTPLPEDNPKTRQADISRPLAAACTWPAWAPGFVQGHKQPPAAEQPGWTQRPGLVLQQPPPVPAADKQRGDHLQWQPQRVTWALELLLEQMRELN